MRVDKRHLRLPKGQKKRKNVTESAGIEPAFHKLGSKASDVHDVGAYAVVALGNHKTQLVVLVRFTIKLRPRLFTKILPNQNNEGLCEIEDVQRRSEGLVDWQHLRQIAAAGSDSTQRNILRVRQYFTTRSSKKEVQK